MPHLLVAIFTSVAIVVIAYFAKVPTYHAAPLFLLPLLWAPFFLRRPLRLRPLEYGLFVVAVIVHDLGAYGYYQQSPLPFSYDIAVHFYFAFAVAFAMHHLLEESVPVLRPWQVNLTTLLFMMGMGALHEIMEYMSYLMLGEAKGMLKPSTSYFFDTQRDLTNNLLGTLLALTIINAYRLATRRESATGRGFDVVEDSEDESAAAGQHA